ncbi:hypothetical protein [Haliangium sp.]|uniref:hypothetical protein n=1 Tax=Haliangium sp. TaxID=2663208 RepID=UPI003D0A840F
MNETTIASLSVSLGQTMSMADNRPRRSDPRASIDPGAWLVQSLRRFADRFW